MSWAGEDEVALPQGAWFPIGLVGRKRYQLSVKLYQCLPEPYQSFTTILCTIET